MTPERKFMRVDGILKLFGKQRILVVGDIMLDRYVRGAVERISPEAPVPVLRVEEDESAPGGAGNVAMNLRTLGAKVELVGSVGKDREGEEVLKLLRENGRRGSDQDLRPLPSYRTIQGCWIRIGPDHRQEDR